MLTWIVAHYVQIIAGVSGVWELVTRIIPTAKDYTIIGNVIKWLIIISDSMNAKKGTNNLRIYASLFSLACFILIVSGLFPFMAPGVVGAVLLVGAAASANTTVQINFLPQALFFVAATVPTLIKITPYGDGPITDLDGNGVTCLGRVGLQGLITNAYYIPLADGLITGKTVELSFTNAVASTVNLYGVATQKGSNYIQCLSQTVLANSGAPVNKFMFAGFPSAAAGDTFQVTYRDGLSHKYVRDDVQGLIQLFQNDVSGYNIQNFNQIIKQVDYVPASTAKIYVMRATRAGVVQQGVFS